MVHPYLRRRNGEEKVAYPSDELRQVLEKTLGVPLFQEQAMKISIVAAGFTPAEADALRRAMATFRKTGAIHGFREKMIGGMTARGYERDFAERCFNQIEGFGEYGFPESHAASFALLVYVSAWLKCHYPAVFACALLNSQPMGFYAPAQIVRDAREHGVEVRPVDANFSAWDCTLEPALPVADSLPQPGQPGQKPGDTSYALRLGLRQIKGFREDDAGELVSRRGNGYPDIRTLWRRGGLPVGALERLARADAFGSIDLGRRDALWAVKALAPAPLPLFAAQDEDDAAAEDPVRLPAMSAGEEVVDDYASLRLSLKSHPMALLRGELAEVEPVPADRLMGIENGRRLTVAGLVLVRQRPGSAKGIVFMTLEDETGVANVIVWPPVFERFRRVVLGARLLAVRGRLQREGIVIHIIAERIVDYSDRLARLGDGAPDQDFPGTEPEAPRASYPSRDFH
jgi:error-prone DNA polymerase